MNPSSHLFLGATALSLALLGAHAASAAITLNSGFNAGSAQFGADATDLSGHATQPTLTYTAIVPLNLENTNYGSNRLNDGLYADPAQAYIPTQDFNINTTPPTSGSFDLVFVSNATVAQIAVNLAYPNRHAGSYTIKDGAGVIRGEFASAGAAAASFFAAFSTPFVTNKLTVEFAVTGNGMEGLSASFREIEIFGQPVPEPGTLALLLPAALGMRIRRRQS